MKKREPLGKITRPPVIVIMGHIDHGKSTLLDYIRKTSIAQAEAGGITQHLSAYEVVHKDDKGAERKITFLDTPGHEAFQKMRLRGAEIADIAILVVSAEEGVKAQTLEAYQSIKKAGIPYIVAITKVDKQNANVDRTKQNIVENEIYLEGMGGTVPSVAISAKTGTGIPELLDMMLLVADLEELTGEAEQTAEGLVIEADLDPQKGISTTLVIRNGTLKTGMFIVSGSSMSPVRILEDFKGNAIKEASFSSPVRVVGWNKLPRVGDSFSSFDTKKKAERAVVEEKRNHAPQTESKETEEQKMIPLILKADVVGSLDAIEHELKKLEQEQIYIKIIHKGVGTVSENDVKVASGSEDAFIVGFNTKIDRAAADLATRSGIEIQTFEVIYKLAEWLEEAIVKRTPKVETKEVVGRAKILKVFSHVKNKQIIGARVEQGNLAVKGTFRILREETEIGHGSIMNLQQQKANVKEVSGEGEFGAQLTSAIPLAPGDRIESYEIRKG